MAVDDEEHTISAQGTARMNDSKPEDGHQESFPDGGLEAWTVVLGASLAVLVASGMINAYGAFQTYYQSTLLPSSTSSTIAFVGSLQVFLLYFLGVFLGKVFDAYGSTFLIYVGSVLSVFSLMMLSLVQTDRAYQVFLSHGVLFGIGISMLFNAAIAVLGHWFQKRLALAIGVATGGSAIGGVVFPILLEQLIPKVGFPWAVRILAFILLACLVVSCATIRTRLPLSRDISWRTVVDLEGWKDPRYSLAGLAVFLLLYPLFIPYFYIQIYADFRGVPAHIGHYLLAIMNAMNVPSRIIPGLLADKYGTLPVFVPVAVACGVLLLGLWLPATGTGAIVAFAALYGLFSGAFVSLVPTYFAEITPRDKFGARLGAVYVVAAAATLCGSPTGGALLSAVDAAHFHRLIVFCGVVMFAGVIALAAAGLVGQSGFRRMLSPRGREEEAEKVDPGFER